MKSNTEFNKYKVKNDELYLPKSGGKVEGEAVFTGGVRFSSGDPKNDLVIKDKRSLGTATGHEYDLEFNNDLDEVTLTEDNVDKTTLPLVAEYIGTRADWNLLSAAEQAKYRIVHFIGEGGTADASDHTVAYTSSDVADGSATSWTSVTPITSGLSLSTLFARVSQMFKNVRYLYKLLGTTDISAIGDGTLTGILSNLNTNAIKRSELVLTSKSSSSLTVPSGSVSWSIVAEKSGYIPIMWYLSHAWSAYINTCAEGISAQSGKLTLSGYAASTNGATYSGISIVAYILWKKN